jgi:hypothetical protein
LSEAHPDTVQGISSVRNKQAMQVISSYFKFLFECAAVVFFSEGILPYCEHWNKKPNILI